MLGLGRVHYRLGDYRRAMDFLGRTVTALTGELLYQSPWGPGPPSVGSRAVLVQCQAELGVFAEGLPTVLKGYGLPRRLIAHTVFSGVSSHRLSVSA